MLVGRCWIVAGLHVLGFFEIIVDTDWVVFDRTPYSDEEEALVEVGQDKSMIWRVYERKNKKEGSGS